MAPAEAIFHVIALQVRETIAWYCLGVKSTAASPACLSFAVELTMNVAVFRRLHQV